MFQQTPYSMSIPWFQQASRVEWTYMSCIYTLLFRFVLHTNALPIIQLKHTVVNRFYFKPGGGNCDNLPISMPIFFR